MNTDKPKDAAEPSPVSSGSVRPVAWVAFAADASESRAVCLTRQEAENVCRTYGWGLAPLYAVRLTGAEREALKTVLRRLREDYFAGRFADSVKFAAVIDGLLERLK